ncbi:MAG TPA: hypothetical protein VNE62_12385 [Actinomycetota bacterium]|nr:hypothetical protein [Actinomycetota bacterium]
MRVWEVFGERRAAEDPVLVGSLLAPDLRMAMLLARESFFRRGEGLRYAVRERGTDELHFCAEDEVVGGVTDKSYRRPDGYVGVGAKFARVRKELAERGLVPDHGPTPTHA